MRKWIINIRRIIIKENLTPNLFAIAASVVMSTFPSTMEDCITIRIPITRMFIASYRNTSR